MSPNDRHFLEQLGIKPEEIAPASEHGVFEPCPSCAARRHRNLVTGEVICLSCAARLDRQNRDLISATAEHPKLFRQPEYEGIEANYRGFQIKRLEGQGWCYRMPGEHVFEQWRKAKSMLDAVRQVNRLAHPVSREVDEGLVENKCRGCDAPCGSSRWCGPCGRDKFGNWQ